MANESDYATSPRMSHSAYDADEKPSMVSVLSVKFDQNMFFGLEIVWLTACSMKCFISLTDDAFHF